MKPNLQGIHPVLASRDVAASVEFYRGLGFALSFQDDPHRPRYAAVARDGVEIHLQWTDPEQWVRKRVPSIRTPKVPNQWSKFVCPPRARAKTRARASGGYLFSQRLAFNPTSQRFCAWVRSARALCRRTNLENDKA